MDKTFFRITLIAVVFVAVAADADRFDAEKSYALAYKMTKGTEFTVKMTGKHRNQRNIMGNDMVTNTEDILVYGFTVKSADADGLRLEMEYVERSRESDDLQTAAGPDFSGLIGEKVKMVLSPTGEVSGFDGFEELPEIVVAEQEMPIGELQYTNEMRGLFPRLPDSPVTLGDSWSDVAVYDEPVGDGTIPVTIRYIYTLVEETRIDENDCLKIDVTSAISINDTITAGGLDLAFKMNGNGTEVLYFAWKKGMFFRRESASVTKGSAENTDMGFSAQMNHKIESIVDVTLN